MVKNRRWPLDRTFAALADPTRRAILARLGAGETSVTDLARPFHVSLPAISRHLRVLEHAGLIERRRDGRSRRCRLLAQPMREAADWIGRYRRFWEHQLDRLAAFLDETAPQEECSWQPRRRPPPSPSGSPAASRRRRNKSSGLGRSPRR